MDSYSSSAETNMNITGNEERKDLGQDFLSETEFEPDSSTDTSNQLCYNSYSQYSQQPFVTCEGFISLFVAKDIRVDINTNHSVCLTTSHLKVSFDKMGHNIGLIHPLGRVYQELDQNSVHIESGAHLAKMYGRGVTFTSLNRSLIYLVDTSGCKTTTERFRKLSYDFTADIFHANSFSGEYARQKAIADLLRHTSELSEDGSDKYWSLAGYRIRYNLVTGDLLINKNYRLSIELSPNKSQLKISSPNLRIIANNRSENCLQVIRPDRRDEQRILISLDRFHVKNGSQKAGFDCRDQLVLY